MSLKHLFKSTTLVSVLTMAMAVGVGANEHKTQRDFSNPAYVKGVHKEAYKTAYQAWLNMQEGAVNGEWKPMLDLLDENVTFYAPVEEFFGFFEGKDHAAKLFHHHSEFTRTDLILNHVVANGNEIGFEIRAEGTIKNHPTGAKYSNQLFMLFVIEDGKITHFREYAAWTGWPDHETARDAFDYRKESK